ncbi:MAG: cytochrome c biogenesis protein ResB [Spirochaetes bacterium]|nr:cytochrome c biogenesis protein ResB [Spirochaetota bacterium]
MDIRKLIDRIASMPAALILLGVIIAASAGATFFPQAIAVKAVYASWWYAALLIIFCLLTLVCVIRHLPPAKGRIGFLMLHVSIPVIAIGALVSLTAGSRGYMQIYRSEALNTIVREDGSYERLPFFIYLADFAIDYYTNGMVKEYASTVRIAEEGSGIVRDAIIRVNHPLTHRGYTVYQYSCDMQNGTWTGFLVQRDPGIGIVYFGFLLLMIGICIRVFERIRKNNDIPKTGEETNGANA